MLNLEEALSKMLALIPAAKAEEVLAALALGRILAVPPTAPIDLPPFSNSAVDGYALRSSDTKRAATQTPVKLKLVGRIPTGAGRSPAVLPGTCVRVFTGSLLPDGADAVVMQEDAEISPTSPDVVSLRCSLEKGECVRLQAEDVRSGAILAESGVRIGAGLIGLLAASGITRIQVGRRPRVGLIVTGSELCNPPDPLQRGQIFESNRATLTALMRTLCLTPATTGMVEDTREMVRSALGRGFKECDVVITSGGVSVGETDHIKQAFEELGGTIHFWRVAVKPGKPFVFGQLGDRFLLGLPGNPVSTLVGFLLLVRPFLLRWQGAGEVGMQSAIGRLGEAIQNPGQRRHFMNVILDAEGIVRLSGPQASHRMLPLARANGLLDVGPGAMLAAGDEVRVLVWGDW